jgi:hypothetical protein
MNSKDPPVEDSVINIALLKSWNYIEEYNPHIGTVEERHGARFLKQGYLDGFLAGFTYRLTGDTEL